MIQSRQNLLLSHLQLIQLISQNFPLRMDSLAFFISLTLLNRFVQITQLMLPVGPHIMSLDLLDKLDLL